MAYTLKLNIYQFSLYRIIREERNIMRGVERMKYYTEDNATSFPDFVRTFTETMDRDIFLPSFFQALVSYFDSQFRMNDEGTKAVSITTNPNPRIASQNYTIDGLFKGGDTGMDKTVYNQRNATTPGSRIGRTDVPASHFFYKLWLPYDGEDGILMVQSYTDMGCTSTFRYQMESFFISKGFFPKWNSLIPTDIINRYLQRSFINKIKIVYQAEPQYGEGIFRSLRQAKKESWLTNLNISFNELFRIDNYRQVLQNQIVETIDCDPNHDLIKVFYQDENGKCAHAGINDLENILPIITLPNELKAEGSEEPNLEGTANYTDGILEQVKTQIGYNVTPIE